MKKVTKRNLGKVKGGVVNPMVAPPKPTSSAGSTMIGSLGSTVTPTPTGKTVPPTASSVPTGTPPKGIK